MYYRHTNDKVLITRNDYLYFPLFQFIRERDEAPAVAATPPRFSSRPALPCLSEPAPATVSSCDTRQAFLPIRPPSRPHTHAHALSIHSAHTCWPFVIITITFEDLAGISHGWEKLQWSPFSTKWAKSDSVAESSWIFEAFCGLVYHWFPWIQLRSDFH